MTAVRLTSVSISALTALAAVLGVAVPPDAADPGAPPAPSAVAGAEVAAAEVTWPTTSTVTPATAAPGDLVTVRIDVELPGEGITWDVAVRDTLPEGLRYVGTSSALCTDPDPCEAHEGTPLVPSGAEMAWFFDDVIPQPVFEPLRLTVVYTAQVEADALPGTLTTAGRVTANGMDRTDTPPTAADLGPGDLVGPTAGATLTVVAPAPGARLTTSVSTALVEAGNGRGEATVGERVTWSASASVDGGAVLDGTVLAVDVPAGLGLTPDAPPVASAEPGGLPAGAVVAVDGPTVSLTVPDGWVVPAGGATLGLRWATDVLDVPAVVAGAVLAAAPVLTATAGGAPVRAEASAGVRVVEPAIAAGRGNNSGSLQVSPGIDIQMSAVAWNAADASTAHDVRIVDAMPTSYVPLGPDGEAPADGGPVGYGGEGVWHAATRTVVWVVGSLSPGAWTEFLFDVRVLDPLPPRTTFVDVATVTASSLPGDVPGERTAPTAPEPQRYLDTASPRLAGPYGYVSMTAAPSAVAVGDTVDLAVHATLPWDVSAYDVTFLVTLPDGLEYVETLTAGCTVGGDCVVGPVVPLASDGRELGWFVGDVPAVDTVEAREVSVVLRARVVPAGGVASGATLTTEGRFAWDVADRLGAPTSVAELGAFDEVTGPGAVDVAVTGPEVGVAVVLLDAAGEPVGDRPVAPGERLTWQVTLAGAGTGTAHDVVVTDTTDPRLGRASAVRGGVAVDGDAGGDGVLVFAVPTPPSGATATLTYDLRVPWPVPGELVGTLTSAVAVAWRTGPEPDAPAGAAAAAPVTVDVRPPGAALAGRVRVESIVDGSLLGYTEGVRVVVRWLGPDKVPGGGDDVRVPTATDADGRWRVESLRPGWYQVRFDPGTLPPLTLPWRDSDGGAPLVTTVHLSTDQVRPRVNLLLAGVGAP